MCHQFIQLVTEGDELYTKVGKNVPQDQSEGWTIVLMDRASRFIWEIRCGKKKTKLFKRVIKTLVKIIENTADFSLFTDGERRYGKILFEICYELIRTGKRGPLRKTLKKGAKVRIKNKGSQSHKKGRKHPKYQSPWQEHPDTDSNIDEKQIHANHVEAFNSSVGERVLLFVERQTHTPNINGVCSGFWMFIG